MAGSRTWRTYISEDGTRYSIELDKSNSNAILPAGGVPAVPIRQSDYPPMPCNLAPRFVYAYNRDNPVKKRKFVVGATSLAALVYTTDGGYLIVPNIEDNIPEDIWIITGYVGEKLSRIATYINNPDTGLTDGTVSQ